MATPDPTTSRDIVLVVDDYTANLPWELMFAGAAGGSGGTLPLALRTPVVRQLAAAQFRRHHDEWADVLKR